MLVSIVMIYRECLAQLQNTLESFRLHGYGEDVEVIIVDDASVDRPLSVNVSDYSFPIKTLRVDPTNRWYENQCVPFSLGADQASGECLVFQQAECIHLDNLVDTISSTVDAFSFVAFSCFSSMDNGAGSGDVLTSELLQHYREIPERSGSVLWLTRNDRYPDSFFLCSAIMHETYKSIGGFDRRYAPNRGSADKAFVHDLIQKHIRVSIADDATVFFQVNRFNDPTCESERNQYYYELVTRGGAPHSFFLWVSAIDTFFGSRYRLHRAVAGIQRQIKRIVKRVRVVRMRVVSMLTRRLYEPLMGSFSITDIPVVINNRNRNTSLKTLVDWLLSAGMRNIIVLDNESTYPPLLEYYRSLVEHPHVTVQYLRENVGADALWQVPLYSKLKSSFYIYTDSDVVPITECPTDVVEILLGYLQQYKRYQKIGLGLVVDDLPDSFEKKEQVVRTESALLNSPIIPHQLYDAPVDTTFALYAPFQKGGAKLRAMRTGFPYMIKHLPWYQDSSNPTTEEEYYRRHANSYSSMYRNTNLKGFRKQRKL